MCVIEENKELVAVCGWFLILLWGNWSFMNTLEAFSNI